MSKRDIERHEVIQRESGRWELLRALHIGGRLGATDRILVHTLVAIYPTVTEDWVREQLDYLERRELVTIERHEIKPWRATLTRHGTDVVEYTVECCAGIARPRKYWGGE